MFELVVRVETAHVTTDRIGRGAVVVEADIERMYRAGRILMPDAAQKLTGIVDNMRVHIGQFDTAAATAGDPAILRAMLQVSGDVHEVLRRCVVTTYDAAEAVIATADHFVRTDERAREEMARMSQHVKNAPNPNRPRDPQGVGSPETPGAPGTPSTPPEVKTPEQDRDARDKRQDGPTDEGGI